MLSSLLAFLVPAAAIATKTAAKTEPVFPTFKPRWWYQLDRLDGRPVVWSLKNRPQDWELSSSSYLLHKPSRHVFVIHTGRICRADCSCHGRSYQRGHEGMVVGAMEEWVKNASRPAREKTYNQFINHFAPPAPKPEL